MRLDHQKITDIFLSDKPTAELAEQYGVSTNTIRGIKRQRTHGNVTGQLNLLPTPTRSRRHILSDQTVRDIYNFTGSVAELKEKFGVSKQVATNIKFRLTYESVTEFLGDPGEIIIHGLTWDNVCAIRASSLPVFHIASIFRVSEGTVRNIQQGRTRRFK